MTIGWSSKSSGVGVWRVRVGVSGWGGVGVGGCRGGGVSGWGGVGVGGVGGWGGAQLRLQYMGSDHDDVIKWKYFPLSALLALCEGNSPVTGEFPARRPVKRSFDILFICVWINDWVNNRDAGGLSRHRAHYDVTIVYGILCVLLQDASAVAVSQNPKVYIKWK